MRRNEDRERPVVCLESEEHQEFGELILRGQDEALSYSYVPSCL